MRRFSMGRYSDHSQPSPLVIVHDSDAVGPVFGPYETDTVLIVDSDTALDQTVSSERFESVSRRDPQFVQELDRVQLFQFPRRDSPKGPRTRLSSLLRVATVEHIFCAGTGERLDHGNMVARLSCYCRRSRRPGVSRPGTRQDLGGRRLPVE